MPRRRSLALDEAAAAEARKAAGEDDSGNGEPGKDEDEVVSQLRSKYVAKEPPKRGRKKKEEEIGPSGMIYTPLEKQYMEIKEKWPDVLLMMEGKSGLGQANVQSGTSTSGCEIRLSDSRFHGDDAKNASKELGIAAFPSRNFYTASIPVHRLQIHVKK